jgi:HSP20 family protein
MHRILVGHTTHDMGHLARHMAQIMDRLVKSSFSPGSGTSPDWVPAVDVCEMPDHYEVIVELAGVRREQIEVYTEDTYLTIAGCRCDPFTRDKVCLHQMEIEQGRFRRRLALPEDACIAEVAARYKDGLLKIRIPKRR